MGEQVRVQAEHGGQLRRCPIRESQLVDDRQSVRVAQGTVHTGPLLQPLKLH